MTKRQQSAFRTVEGLPLAHLGTMRLVVVALASVHLFIVSVEAQMDFIDPWVGSFDAYRGAGLTLGPLDSQLDSEHYTVVTPSGETQLNGVYTTGQWARGLASTPSARDPLGLYAFDMGAADYGAGAIGPYLYRLHMQVPEGVWYGAFPVLRIDYRVHWFNVRDGANTVQVCFFETGQAGGVYPPSCGEPHITEDAAEANPSWTSASRSFLAQLVEPWSFGDNDHWLSFGSPGPEDGHDAFSFSEIAVRVAPTCGNGRVDFWTMEECDEGLDNGTSPCGCDLNCQYPSSSTVCRPARNFDLCDVAEYCDGAGTCPRDRVRPAGYHCRDARGLCDLHDRCDGVSKACPNLLVPQGVECGPATGPCDAVEVCDGLGAACPDDEVLGAGAVCASASGDCDIADICDGRRKSCPARYADASTLCNPSQGACDVAEYCTGLSSDCPADQYAVRGTICRPGSGCLQDAVCSGSVASCPRNPTAPAGTVCNPSRGPCDMEEVCDGSSRACPDDEVARGGLLCRAARPQFPCDADDRCDGHSTACVDEVLAEGTQCREPDDPRCDSGSSCNGIDAICPSGGERPNGASCSDDISCNGDERCRDGRCHPGTPPTCDDGDECTIDECVEPAGCMRAPIEGCCHIDAECDDRDPCTLDTCVDTSCEHVAVMCGMDGGAVFDAGFVDSGTTADSGNKFDAMSGDAGFDSGSGADSGSDDSGATIDSGALADSGSAIDSGSLADSGSASPSDSGTTIDSSSSAEMDSGSSHDASTAGPDGSGATPDSHVAMSDSGNRGDPGGRDAAVQVPDPATMRDAATNPRDAQSGSRGDADASSPDAPVPEDESDGCSAAGAAGHPTQSLVWLGLFLTTRRRRKRGGDNV